MNVVKLFVNLSKICKFLLRIVAGYFYWRLLIRFRRENLSNQFIMSELSALATNRMN